MSRQQEFEKLRALLLERQDALLKALSGDMSGLQELRDRTGEDEVDSASFNAQDDLNSQLAEAETRELIQIERALERMEAGTYGICEVTGKPIPMARLKALPFATMSIEAQRAKEEAEQPDDIQSVRERLSEMAEE
jgi:DnaK suppressor protein